ncbi:N-glycosylase/DNA lyase [Dictyoglomus thermophilum]|uniref:8-oxoguanine DNA glycosylase/AP lyase n=1 Tax=Dictyoglomus thermophilum (strain ATCC 35947 / DSM 3960 / H-6-12) TaxID=309799 RepID=B5YBX1_DICT6|nr:N-glycosylase/DNA lyase [Dictyoglomus thermophilum]ACI20165.1 N-glycosylase/DNA lyase [Dictyoglomus thermophilum H-6-12]
MYKYRSAFEKIKSIEEIAYPLVERRIREFEALGKYGDELDLFSELSFCVLTANWSAERGIKAQESIGKANFAKLSFEELLEKLKEVGHRYPISRARFIVENRRLIGRLRSIWEKPSREARKILVGEAKGIGWKEASHFLRNTGKLDLAILDKHILRFLFNEGIIKEMPKGWTQRKYEEIEEKFVELSSLLEKTPGEVDLYIWFLLKGKVEK